MLRRGLHRGQVDKGGVGRGLFEQIDDPLVAGQDKHLVRAGKIDEGGGGTPGAFEIEVHEHLVDDDWQALRFFTHALNEGADAGLVQPFEAPHELDLCRKAAIGPVEDVAGHQQRIHATVDAEVDHPFVSLERGVPQDVRHTRFGLTDALERTVQVQIGGVVISEEMSCRDRYWAFQLASSLIVKPFPMLLPAAMNRSRI